MTENSPNPAGTINRRLRTKFLNGVIACIAGSLVLVYLLNYSNRGAPPGFSQSGIENLQPAYFLVHTTSIQFDAKGKLDYTLYSETVRHDPSDDSAKLTAPHFELFKNGTLDWIVDSQLGIISPDRETVDLQQRVVVASHDQQTILKSPQLIIFPDKKLAKTDKPVTLQNPNGFTRSIGLIANMDNKRIDLLDQVRGQYQGVLFEDEK